MYGDKKRETRNARKAGTLSASKLKELDASIAKNRDLKAKAAAGDRKAKKKLGKRKAYHSAYNEEHEEEIKAYREEHKEEREAGNAK